MTVNNHFPDVHASVGLEIVIIHTVRLKVNSLNLKRLCGIRIVVLKLCIPLQCKRLKLPGKVSVAIVIVS